jgi:hypothetical protein
MRHISFAICFLFLTVFCYAQQALPDTIIGRIPNIADTKIFQIQVGAFSQEQNAERAYLRLQMNALNPTIAKSTDYLRVLVRGIPANQVYNFLVVIKRAGFNEVIIREDIANENRENIQIVVPNADIPFAGELSNSEFEEIINDLSDGEFLNLLSLMGEFPNEDLMSLINSIKNQR